MKKPDYLVYITQETDNHGEKNTFWTKVGAAFVHKEKPGLNIIITPGIAVSGKLVLIEPKDDTPV